MIGGKFFKSDKTLYEMQHNYNFAVGTYLGNFDVCKDWRLTYVSKFDKNLEWKLALFRGNL